MHPEATEAPNELPKLCFRAPLTRGQTTTGSWTWIDILACVKHPPSDTSKRAFCEMQDGDTVRRAKSHLAHILDAR